jgi:heme oxygenase
MNLPTEEQVVKSLADYENTNLIYSRVNKQIEEYHEQQIMYQNEKELRKLEQLKDDIDSRYRLNPFVDEVDGKYKFWSPIELLGLKEQGWF